MINNINRYFFQTVIFIITLFASVNTYAGGGWPQPKGSGYFKLGQYGIVANSYFTPAGDIVDITTTGYYSTFVYGEYGITDKLTATVYFPFFSRSTLNRVEDASGELVQEGEEVNSLGDTDVSIKYNLYNKGVAVSASLTLGLPLGNPSGGASGLLQTGDGEFNQMLSVEASKSFGEGKFYATAMLGFNNRTQGFSDEVRYGLEGGYHFSNFWAIMRIDGRTPLMNGNEDFIPNNGIFSNNIEYIGFNPELVYEVKDNWGFSVGAGFAANAKRILAAPAFNAGIYLKI